MCGIFGIAIKEDAEYKPEDLKKLAGVLFKLSESRGKEAAGLAVKSDSSIDVLKSPLSASDFIKNEAYKNFWKEIEPQIATDKEPQITTDTSNDQWKSVVIGNPWKSVAFSIIGHSRLATHGSEYDDENNQPVIKDGLVGVHNGIIANDKELWKAHPDLEKNYEVDTEVFLSLLKKYIDESGSLNKSLNKLFGELEGSASVAVLFEESDTMFLATNTGSLYYLFGTNNDIFVFASESYILEEFIKKSKNIVDFDSTKIIQLRPGTALALDLKDLKNNIFGFADSVSETPDIIFKKIPKEMVTKISEKKFPAEIKNINFISADYKISPEIRKEMMEEWEKIYAGKGLKRCVKCLMPSTMPFVEFDSGGVCDYCRNFRPLKTKGEVELEKVLASRRRNDGKPDCVVPFSGGRDSSYGLHYIKKVLGMNPIAFTYDWGVMTDLGRRNEARMCGALGIEHIIISADIRKKRKNVKMNLEAWLKRPRLGMIPLLMAGDKELLKQTDWLMKKTGIDFSIDCYGEGLEDDLIKVGFAGLRVEPGVGEYQYLGMSAKFKLMKYYFTEFITNPSYINTSLFDTFFGAYCAFLFPCRSLHLFNYIKWDEDEILSTIGNYGWEREKETIVTWRIDDGTAALYNYIYMTATGFNENDVFRSFQIRAGHIDRKKAYELIKGENKPRFDSLEWYARTIGFDINKAIRVINSMPKLY